MSNDPTAHVRLGVTFDAPRPGQEGVRVHWRLEAKDPGDSWTLRSTVGFGSFRVHGCPYPPSRDDVLSTIIELVMGARWDANGVTFV